MGSFNSQQQNSLLKHKTFPQLSNQKKVPKEVVKFDFCSNRFIALSPIFLDYSTNDYAFVENYSSWNLHGLLRAQFELLQFLRARWNLSIASGSGYFFILNQWVLWFTALSFSSLRKFPEAQLIRHRLQVLVKSRFLEFVNRSNGFIPVGVQSYSSIQIPDENCPKHDFLVSYSFSSFLVQFSTCSAQLAAKQVGLRRNS